MVRDRLKEVREGRGLSQKDLATRSGVHFNSISGIESGKRKPHPSTLRKLAAALEVEVEVLTGAPKGDAPSAERPVRTPEERRNSYLLGFEDLAKSTATRLQEAIESEDVDFEQVDQIAKLHEDLQRIAVERIGLLHEGAYMPEAEVQAQERVAAALDDLRSVVDQGYSAAISMLQGRKAEVGELDRIRRQGGTTEESRGVRSA